MRKRTNEGEAGEAVAISSPSLPPSIETAKRSSKVFAFGLANPLRGARRFELWAFPHVLAPLSFRKPAGTHPVINRTCEPPSLIDLT